MALSTAFRLPVGDRSGVAPARRAAERLADELGFSEQRRGEVAIVVSELATNLVRHAGSGEIILGVDRGAEPILRVVASDHGPGIAEPARAREDGYSTGGGPGNGLGAVGRLSSTMDFQTGAQGTVIAARFGSTAGFPIVDGVALAMAGEEASGDAWGHVEDGAHVTVMLADGLGHGAEAARAASLAVRELRGGADPLTLMESAHRALPPTRGAAAAVARFHVESGALEFAGIGNIAATIVDGRENRSLVSMPGILGHGVQRFRAFTYTLPPGGVLVMHSDGCRNSWDLADYPGALRRDPLVIAALILRDFERRNDDASVVVARARH